eukprot:81316_1
MCTNCSSRDEETVFHFILECSHYKPQRERLFDALSNIWNGFNNLINRSLDNLLFPFNIVDNDGSRLKIQCQAKIWKSLLKYVYESQRFKDTELYNIDIEKIK